MMRVRSIGIIFALGLAFAASAGIAQVQQQQGV